MKFIPKFTNSVDQVPKAAGSMIFDINKKSLNFDYKASDSGEITRYELKGGSGGSGSGLPDFSEQEAGSVIKVVDNESSAVLKTPLKSGDTSSNCYILKKEVEDFDLSTLDWEASSVIPLYESYTPNGSEPVYEQIGKMIPGVKFTATIYGSEQMQVEFCIGWAMYDELGPNYHVLGYCSKEPTDPYWEGNLWMLIYAYENLWGKMEGWMSDYYEEEFTEHSGKYFEKLNFKGTEVSLKIDYVYKDNIIFSSNDEIELIPPEENKSAIWTPLLNAHGENQILKVASGKFYKPFLLKYMANASGGTQVDDDVYKIYFNTEAAIDFSKDAAYSTYCSLIGLGEKLWPTVSTQNEEEDDYYIPFGYFYEDYEWETLYSLNAAFDYTNEEDKISLVWVTKYNVSYDYESSTTTYTISDQTPIYTSTASYSLTYIDSMSEASTTVDFGEIGWAMDSWSPSNSYNDLHCTINEYQSKNTLYSFLGQFNCADNTVQPLGAYISKNNVFVGYEQNVTYKWVDKSLANPIYPSEDYNSDYSYGPSYFAYQSYVGKSYVEYKLINRLSQFGVATYSISGNSLCVNYSYNSGNNSSQFYINDSDCTGIITDSGKNTILIQNNNFIFAMIVEKKYSSLKLRFISLSPDANITSVSAHNTLMKIAPLSFGIDTTKPIWFIVG